MRLRGGVGMIPGGILFVDQRTGMAWRDDHTFLDERVKEVISFRLQNPKYYPPEEGKWLDAAQVAQEITDYNCTRLGNNPNYCFDQTQSAVNVNAAKSVAPAERKCPDCKADLVPRMCKTCGGGGKVNGWDCPVCKKSF